MQNFFELRNGVGDFACGNGTLEGGGGLSYNHWHYGGGFSNVAWQLDWTATFTNGVGELSGTAWKFAWGSWDPNPDEVRELSGTILVDDGAATGNCDDSAGASRFAAVIVLE